MRMKKSISVPGRIALALLLAALAVGCALAGKAAKTPEPAPKPTPTPIPTSELQPAGNFSGLMRDENVSFTLRSETLSLAAIRENAAHLRAKRASGEEVNKVRDYIEALLVNMTVRNDTGKELVLCRPELETLRDGVWYRLEYETRRKTDELEGPLRANAVARGAIPLADLDGGCLVPGEYRVCIPYYIGKAQGGADHVAVAEFALAEALEPKSLTEAFGLDPDKFVKLEFSGPLGMHTLQRGEEGFAQIFEFLGSLRGSSSYIPQASVHCSVKLVKENGTHDFLMMEYDGERVMASVDYSDYLALESEGRPDLELEALFARYAKAPDPIPYDPGKYVVDGLLSLTPARSVIDHDALQEAIGISLRRYTEPQPVGESVAAEEGAILWMTAKNVGEKTIYYDPPLSILALRDGDWYWVRLRYDFMSDLILRSLSPGETAECAVGLHLFDDPLEPGQYCVCMFYTVDETGKSPYDHVAFAPFVITDGEPLPAPEPTPAPAPEPDDGTELLMGTVKREKIKSVEYSLNAYDDYLLERGDEGFERIMDKLWSLRGVPCEEPASRLVARGFDFNSHVFGITLVFDGEWVYGSMFQDQWLLLDAEGRPDQELTELFRRWGRNLETPTRLDASPSKLGGMIEDGSLVMATEYPAYDPKPLLSAYARYIEQYRISGMEQDIRLQDLCIGIRLENHTDTMIHHDGEFALEAFRDGEWRLVVPGNLGYMGVGYGLSPWEQQSEWVFPIINYDEEALTPGRYRICLPYRVGDGKGYDHVAFAEFDLTDGPPVPDDGTAEVSMPALGPGEERLLAAAPEEIDSISCHLWSWETYTLRRGMEGFSEALEALLALRGTPVEKPMGTWPILELDAGGLLDLKYDRDGERLLGFTDGRCLDLSAMGWPGDDLWAIFERYGEREPREVIPVDDRNKLIDESLVLTVERPAYDHEEIREAVRQQKRATLRAMSRGQGPRGAEVELTLENRTDGMIGRAPTFGVQALREGQWIWLSNYRDFGTTLTLEYLEAGETAEGCLYLSTFDDLLTPGLYRAVVWYSVEENGTVDFSFEHLAYAEFEITGGPD